MTGPLALGPSLINPLPRPMAWARQMTRPLALGTTITNELFFLAKTWNLLEFSACLAEAVYAPIERHRASS